jgi:hypothetical protein
LRLFSFALLSLFACTCTPSGYATEYGNKNGQKKTEIKTAQEALSVVYVVYVIKGQALTRAADQLQQIQSTDQAETDKPVDTLQSGLGEIVEAVIECRYGLGVRASAIGWVGCPCWSSIPFFRLLKFLLVALYSAAWKCQLLNIQSH